MNSLLIRDVMHRGKNVDIRIRNGIFETIASGLVPEDGEKILSCSGRYAVLPPFYNGHNHAAMTLLRGYADDKELFTWLNESIWPVEAKMTADDVYAGSRLAILEMIRSGTVFFNDSYWFPKATLRAAEEMGIRACIGNSLPFIGRKIARTHFFNLNTIRHNKGVDIYCIINNLPLLLKQSSSIKRKTSFL